MKSNIGVIVNSDESYDDDIAEITMGQHKMTHKSLKRIRTPKLKARF